MKSQDLLGDPHGNRETTEDTLPDALRWQLRDLRREGMPEGDLWPGIAARLEPQRVGHSRGPRPWALPAALAATLALALGFVGWQQGLVLDQPAVPSPIAATLSATPTPVQREAAAMTRQYQAALVEVDRTVPDAKLALQPTFDELDHSARLILDALARDPDSRLLLQQLRRTYSHRLALAQRLAIS